MAPTDRILRLLRQARRRLLGGPPAAAPPPPEPPYQWAAGGAEVWTPTPEPPYPFQNVLDNDAYFTVIDQCGRGLGRHMTPEGHANQVIASERLVYVRDDASGEFFLLGWAPACRPCERFRCTAGLNYTVIEQRALGLEAAWRLYVPAGADPLEIWDVRLRDLTGRPRRISLFVHVAMTCEGTDLYTGEMGRIAKYVPEVESLFVRMDAERHWEINFPRHNGFLTACPAPVGWDANPGAFLGPRATLAAPRAVVQGKCENSMMAMWPPVAALHLRLEAPAHGEAHARILAGACDHEEDIRALREKYLECGARSAERGEEEYELSELNSPRSALRTPHSSFPPDAHFLDMRNEQKKITANLAIQTPEPQMNLMLNTWVKKQIHHGAVWGRWGFKGYRDALQQAVGVAALAPARARRNILDCCRHQYADGFALRGWRPIDTKRYADSAQWLIHGVTEYLKETGDFALLDEEAPYFDGGAGPVREHVWRALERLRADRGPHGLCLAHGGDWNDSLTGVCRRGRGESVWLSMAFCRCALLLEELALELNDSAEADRMRAWGAEMRGAIETHAWDGEWYRCAFDDDGNAIGSAACEEGKIFLIIQAWAVWGRVAGDERWRSAWAAVRRHLDTGWGFRLVWPSYTRPQRGVGRLSFIRPGATENGSVYTHGNAFMVVALLERGLPSEALALWRAIAPGNPARPLCQPNVFFSGYYGPDSEILPGLADHPWMTGSAAWMLYAATELLLGARRTYRGLVMRPCLPAAWPGATLTRTYRGTTYRIKIENPGAAEAAAVARITIDGAEHPIAAPLPIDGATHEVGVTLDSGMNEARSAECEARRIIIDDQASSPHSALRAPRFSKGETS